MVLATPALRVEGRPELSIMPGLGSASPLRPSPGARQPDGNGSQRPPDGDGRDRPAPQVPPRAADTPGPQPRLIQGYVAGRVAYSSMDGPGCRYLLFLQGCQLDCLTCPRPMMMPMAPPRMAPKTVDDVLVDIGANAPYLNGVTVSGGEPTMQPEFLGAVLRAMSIGRSTSRLTRFVATNGNTPVELWPELAPLLHGVMVNLTSIDEERNVILTGHSNRRVLATIEEVARRGLLYEVRLPLVPGVNDGDAELRRTAAWLLELDPQIRVRVAEFRRRGTRACARDLAEPRRTDFKRYWRVLSGAGIEHLVVP